LVKNQLELLQRACLKETKKWDFLDCLKASNYMCSTQCWKQNFVQMAASVPLLNGTEISIVRHFRGVRSEEKIFTDKGQIHSIQLPIRVQRRLKYGSEAVLLGRCLTPRDRKVWEPVASWYNPSSSQISVSEFLHRVQMLAHSKNVVLQLQLQVEISKQIGNTIVRGLFDNWRGESVEAIYELFSDSNSLGYYDALVGSSFTEDRNPFFHVTFVRSFPLDTNFFNAAMGFLAAGDVQRGLYFAEKGE
jgi:hypothetical protein